MSIRKRTHDILEARRPEDRTSQVVQLFIITLIVLNVTAVILSTVDTVQRQYGPYLWYFEIFSVIVFTAEYVLRVWSCIEDERFNGPVTGRLRYMVTPGAIIDLLAILPFFLPRLTGLDLRSLRALRLFRLLRLLKLGRFSRSVGILGEVLKQKWSQILIAALAVTVALVFAASLMYLTERQAQPEHFSSIPAAMWWGVITLTTVGYGDVTPVTPLGRALGGLIALLGIGLFALPAGILASGFEEAMEKRQELENDDEDDSSEDENGDREADEDRSAENGGVERRDAKEKYCSCCGQPLPEAQEREKE